MAIWLVNASWTEDDAEASEQWEAHVNTAEDAVREVTKHLRFPPHHIEARRLKPQFDIADFPYGGVRRILSR